MMLEPMAFLRSCCHRQDESIADFISSPTKSFLPKPILTSNYNSFESTSEPILADDPRKKLDEGFQKSGKWHGTTLNDRKLTRLLLERRLFFSFKYPKLAVASFRSSYFISCSCRQFVFIPKCRSHLFCACRAPN